MHSLGLLTARICKRGHVIEDDHGKEKIRIRATNGPLVTVTSSQPTYIPAAGNYCRQCGEPILCECEHCGRHIPGIPALPQGVPYARRRGDYARPAYCEFCGKPYPWTVSALNEIGRLLEKGIDEGSLGANTFNTDAKGFTKQEIQEAIATIEHKGVRAVAAWAFLKDVMANLVAGETADRIKEIASALGDWFC